MKKIHLSKETIRVLTAQEVQAVAGAALYPELPPYSSRPDRCPVATGLCSPQTNAACPPPVITRQPGCVIVTAQPGCLPGP